MDVYFDREPYANADALHTTRFLGLAPVGNKNKQVPQPTFGLNFLQAFVKVLTSEAVLSHI